MVKITPVDVSVPVISSSQHSSCSPYRKAAHTLLLTLLWEQPLNINVRSQVGRPKFSEDELVGLAGKNI